VRRKEVKVAVFSTLLLLSFLTAAINVMPTMAQEVRDVPSVYPTIQAAINAANPGDIVRVAAGTYPEQITVNKELTLIGENRETTIIDGSGSTVVTVTVDNVTMSGFKVTNGDVGIRIDSEGCNITDNLVISYTDLGIGIFFDYNNIAGNLIQANMQQEQGIYFWDAYYNTVFNNTISSNGFGIFLQDSNENHILNNQVTDNGVGIAVKNSSDNRIYYNNIINNTGSGSGMQVISENYPNAWDNGYPNGGNYWSDYTGVDQKKGPNQDQPGSDGIGDTPYPIKNPDGEETGYKDRYPFMQPVVEDVTPPVTTNDYDGSWHNTDFNINLTASDDISGVNATYYEINNGPTKTVSADGQPFISEESAHNTLEYWSVDRRGNTEVPHVLTDVKLDKTAPTGSILINDNEVNTMSRSVTLNLLANDVLSGVSKMRFRNEEFSWSAWEQYAITKAWRVTTGGGTKTVYSQFMDNAGLTSPLYSDSIILVVEQDSEPPATTNNYDGQWHNADFNITLTADDDLSGVAETNYKINNGTVRTVDVSNTLEYWSINVVITTEGAENTLEYWSVDQKGNVEAPKVLTGIKLDKTLPTVSILSPSNGSEIKSSSFTVNWTGTDALSGIDHYEIRLDEGSWVNVTGQTYMFTDVSNGNHKVVVQAVDKAGLTSESSVNLIVSSEGGGIGLIEEIVLAIVAIVIVGVVLFFIFRSRRKANK
jgi:parallel beta-helix repeat protein